MFIVSHIRSLSHCSTSRDAMRQLGATVLKSSPSHRRRRGSGALPRVTTNHKPIRNMPDKTPTIIVTVEGGIVQGVIADLLCRVAIVDYDTEGAEEEDLRDIPQCAEFGGGTET